MGVNGEVGGLAFSGFDGGEGGREGRCSGHVVVLWRVEGCEMLGLLVERDELPQGVSA